MWINRGKEQKKYKVDVNITDAIQAWFDYGLSPGSCTEYLLRGNYERAKMSAHMLIRPDEIWNDHIAYVENCVPDICRGENYESWRGYADYVARKRCREIVEKELSDSGAFEL